MLWNINFFDICNLMFLKMMTLDTVGDFLHYFIIIYFK